MIQEFESTSEELRSLDEMTLFATAKGTFRRNVRCEECLEWVHSTRHKQICGCGIELCKTCWRKYEQ